MDNHPDTPKNIFTALMIAAALSILVISILTLSPMQTKPTFPTGGMLETPYVTKAGVHCVLFSMPSDPGRIVSTSCNWTLYNEALAKCKALDKQKRTIAATKDTPEYQFPSVQGYCEDQVAQQMKLR